MDVIYSIGTKMGSGIGYTAQKAVEQIKKAGYLKQLITLDNIPVESNNPLLKDNTFDVLASIIIKPDIDIAHIWGHFALAQLRRSQQLGAKVILERASSSILNQKKILEEEYKRFGIKGDPIHPWVIKKQLIEYKETDYITLPSYYAYGTFIDEGYPEEKLFLNPFGVDINKFKPMKVEKDDKFRVLFIGENWIRKGIFYLLKAWNQLNLKNAELIIRSNIPFFGDIDYSSIYPLEWVDDIVDLYNKIDVFCFPTLEEGNALVVGELAACSVPSITTFNSGTWLDEKSCFFVPTRDIVVLKEKIQYCYDNPDEVKKVGQNARKIAEKSSWDEYGKRLIKNYEKIIS